MGPGSDNLSQDEGEKDKVGKELDSDEIPSEDK